MYTGSRGGGLGLEVKRRILMGTYALSAGYYDAYYKRAQQVRARTPLCACARRVHVRAAAASAIVTVLRSGKEHEAVWA